MIFFNCCDHGNLRVEAFGTLQNVRSRLRHGDSTDPANINIVQDCTKRRGNGSPVKPVKRFDDRTFFIEHRDRKGNRTNVYSNNVFHGCFLPFPYFMLSIKSGTFSGYIFY